MVDIIKQDMTDIWAIAGDVVAPDSAKVRAGWAVEAVPRQWWNWFENRQDTNIAYMLQKGIPEWDQFTEYLTNKSLVQRSGIVYKCILTGVNKDPLTSPLNWAKAFADSTPYLERIKNLPVTAGTVALIDGAANAGQVYYGQIGLNMLGATTALQGRQTIDAQQANGNLTALSAVIAVTNALPYFTGSNTMGTTPLTAFGRNFVAQDSNIGGRNALGLGTASVYNAQPTPTSTGTLMFSGAFGLGGYSIISNTSSVNVNDPNCPSGFYDVAPDTIVGFVAPIPSTWTRIIHQCHSNSAGFATQIATANFATAGIARIFVRKAVGGPWSSWVELMNSSTFPTQASQLDDAGNVSAGIGGGKLLRTGAFGVGARLDLRGTIYSVGLPNAIQGTGTVRGFALASELAIPGYGASDYGTLTVDAHWTESTGIRGYTRTFSDGFNMWMQPSGSNIDQPWGAWRQIYNSSNTQALTDQVTASIQPTLNAKVSLNDVAVTIGATDGVDPNTTTTPWILCSHPTNTPDSAYYWYVNTTWYAGKGTGNRYQTAVAYNGNVTAARSYFRLCYTGVWGPWIRCDMGGNAATASKWQAPRTISLYGGVSGSITLDGSGDVSSSITVLNDSHLHSISRVTDLQAQLDARTPTAGQPNFSAAQSELGASVPAGQAIFSVTPTQAANGFAAACTFLRNGYYGVNLGLSSQDNNLRIGGFSMGAVTYPILHTGNAAGLGFGATTGAFGTSGWTRLGNGMIIQYGPFTGDGFVTFPTAFPNAVGAVTQMQSAIASGNVTRIALNGAPAVNGFNVTGVTSQNLPARWIAIGY